MCDTNSPTIEKLLISKWLTVTVWLIPARYAPLTKTGHTYWTNPAYGAPLAIEPKWSSSSVVKFALQTPPVRMKLFCQSWGVHDRRVYNERKVVTDHSHKAPLKEPQLECFLSPMSSDLSFRVWRDQYVWPAAIAPSACSSQDRNVAVAQVQRRRKVKIKAKSS